MKEVYLYKKLPKRAIRCNNCAHYCNLFSGKRGVCGVRENIDGTLYVLNYGKLVACNIDPVEKKPLFHFLPGTKTLSVSTVGCNMRCKNCQNFDISQNYRNEKIIPGKEISPKELIDIAIQNNLNSISYTYVEPTVFLEYALDTMKLAKEKGLKNIWVSNGFLSKEALNLVLPYLDGVNIDIKSFSDNFYRENCGARLAPVLETAKSLKKHSASVEITTLVLPTLSDSYKNFTDIAKFIKKELGPDTPWHISRFSGELSWKLKHLPQTPETTLQTAYDTGKKEGLQYVYVGNTGDASLSSTFCPVCKTLAIERSGHFLSRHDKMGKCKECGKDLNLII